MAKSTLLFSFKALLKVKQNGKIVQQLKNSKILLLSGYEIATVGIERRAPPHVRASNVRILQNVSTSPRIQTNCISVNANWVGYYYPKRECVLYPYLLHLHQGPYPYWKKKLKRLQPSLPNLPLRY